MSARAPETTLLPAAAASRCTLSDEQLVSEFRDTLNTGLHGICFSPYEGAQKPGSPINARHIRKRLDIIRPYTKWIRTFSCTDGNELIPRIAKASGLKTIVGAWLEDDETSNEEELENVIEIARAGHADVVAVGNEVLYRKEMEEAELLEAIAKVRKALPDHIPVGYVDAYYEFVNRPAITEACDIVLANCYPYWESCGSDYSLLYMKEMYRQTTRAAGGKRVLITESGWPSAGTAQGAAIPSERNAMSYFINAQKWSREEGIELFYFSSFDEAWKVGDEGDVGAHWGIWDTQGNLKYQSS